MEVTPSPLVTQRKVTQRASEKEGLLLTEEGDTKREIIFYDKNLHTTNRLNLTDLLKDTGVPDLGISVDETGTKIAVPLLSNGFGIYDIIHKQWMDVGDPLKENESCLSVAFMKNGTLSCLMEEASMEYGANSYYFGVYNSSSKHLQLKKINYIPKPIKNPNEQLFHTDNLLYLNDKIDPRKHANPTSGKVVVMDTNAMDVKAIQVDGVESAYSRITPDGQHMISVKQNVDKKGACTSVHIRVYDMKTMAVLNDDTITTPWIFDKVYVNNKGFLVSLQNKKDTKVVYYGL